MFSNPEFDMLITIFLLMVAAIISGIVFAFSKKIFTAVVVFSILANLSFLVNMWSRMFVYYHLKILLYFSLVIWPILNIILIIKYLKNKKNEKNN